MAISSTNHLTPGSGSNLPAVANRLLQQAQQALGVHGAPDAQTPVGIQDGRNQNRPGIQSRANGIDRTLDAQVEVPRTSTAEQREKLVLRPSEVPLEDRMELVMSLEDVQRLLLVRSPTPEAPGLTRSADLTPGQILDFRT